MTITDTLESYTISLLRNAERFLLLQRSPTKKLFPGRWSGLGGKVETDEFGQIRASALREVWEEAGISPDEIRDFVLRRTLLVSRPLQPLRLLFYFTGVIDRASAPECTEGILFWKTAAEFDALDIIETTRPALYDLIADMNRDPHGNDLPKIGHSAFAPDGAFRQIVWENS
jgi:8-oxo-dGTP diphosphatase